MPRTVTAEELTNVLARYEVGALLSPPEMGGGTANANVILETEAGRFFLKRRNPKYAQREYVAFDHRLMEHLAPFGIGTPLAVRRRSGERWLEWEGAVYELYPYQPGGAHDRYSCAQLAAAGRSLAAFHHALRSFTPPPGKEWPRYHDPRLLRESVDTMAGALQTWMSGEDFAYLLAQVASLEHAFPEERYHALPRQVVHGDYHPGNVKFQGDAVSGIFDLDWATVQPRLLDLADGVFLFAGERDSDIDASDIVSLTQTWRPSARRTRVFLEAYLETETVRPEEWDALDPAIRARWLYCRVAGRLKLPEVRRLDYVTDGLLEPLRALDDLGQALW
jgi:Ser/Thr protein kinase RdoA (MazF antagonist)